MSYSIEMQGSSLTQSNGDDYNRPVYRQKIRREQQTVFQFFAVVCSKEEYRVLLNRMDFRIDSCLYHFIFSWVSGESVKGMVSS